MPRGVRASAASFSPPPLLPCQETPITSVERLGEGIGKLQLLTSLNLCLGRTILSVDRLGEGIGQLLNLTKLILSLTARPTSALASSPRAPRVPGAPWGPGTSGRGVARGRGRHRAAAAELADPGLGAARPSTSSQ